MKTMKTKFGYKFYPNKDTMGILEQVPKGARTMFIEQAIMQFAKNNPSISFFFEGVTKTKKKSVQGSNLVAEPKNEALKAQKVAEVKIAHSSNQSDEVEDEGNKMMFGFANMRNS